MAQDRETVRLRELAQIAGWDLDLVYRRFRLESAPAPFEHPGGVPHYDLAQAYEFLTGSVYNDPDV